MIIEHRRRIGNKGLTAVRRELLGGVMAFLYRDCGCSAHWSGDELTVRPCADHAAEWTPDLDDALKFATPPLFSDPPYLSVPPRVLHGDN